MQGGDIRVRLFGLLCGCCHFLDRNVTDILNEYVADQVYQHHDNPDLSLSKLWHASGLWTFLRRARKDPQIDTLLNPIRRVLESMGVKVSSYKLRGCRQPASSQSATHEEGGVQQRSGQPQSKSCPQLAGGAGQLRRAMCPETLCSRDATQQQLGP